MSETRPSGPEVEAVDSQTESANLSVEVPKVVPNAEHPTQPAVKELAAKMGTIDGHNDERVEVANIVQEPALKLESKVDPKHLLASKPTTVEAELFGS